MILDSVYGDSYDPWTWTFDIQSLLLHLHYIFTTINAFLSRSDIQLCSNFAVFVQTSDFKTKTNTCFDFICQNFLLFFGFC